MPGGRPTTDPKTVLLVARVPERIKQRLLELARAEGITLSEAVRRALEPTAPRGGSKKKKRRTKPRHP